MDQVVFRAMEKWPNVPAVFGWLALDRRGRWRLQGQTITHPKTLRFIERNYACDERGRWFFQNGPQRVFVALEYTPWVARLESNGDLVLHTGLAVETLGGVWLDDEGNLLVLTPHGLAVVDDRDLCALIDSLTRANGADIDDETLEAEIDRVYAGEPVDIGLHYRSSFLALATARRAHCPTEFDYIRDPNSEDI